MADFGVLEDSVHIATYGFPEWGMMERSKFQPLSTTSTYSWTLDDLDDSSIPKNNSDSPCLAIEAMPSSSLGQSSCFSILSTPQVLKIRLDHVFRELGQLVMSPSFKGNRDLQNTALGNARAILTVSASLRFTEAYFTMWHPSCPILHKPTYNPCSVNLPLLLSVILMGAVYSPFPSDVKVTQDIADIAEQYIFQQPELSGVFKNDRDKPILSSISHLEVLQSATLMVIMQNWEGLTPTKLRVRKSPMSRLVKVGKNLHLCKVYQGSINN
jgi:Fungal specific transcription factor domain